MVSEKRHIKRCVLWLTLACSFLFIVCNHALFAGVNPEPINWTVNYTADTMPNLAHPAWVIWGDNSPTKYTSVNNGIVTLDTLGSDANTGEGWFISWGAAATSGQIIEARLKIYPGTEVAGVCLGFSDDIYGGNITFMPDRIMISTADGQEEYLLDTTDSFHTYRITRYGKESKVYIDGAAEPALSVKAPFLSSVNFPSQIFWGDGTGRNDGKADWDYIKYCLNVPYASPEKKNSISKKPEPERRIVRQGEVEIEVTDYSQKDIYHSPETPGWTEWVSLWQIPGGNLQCSFCQQTGPKEKPIGIVPIIESRDGGDTWTRVPNDIPVDGGSCSRGIVVLKDGTLVRATWGDPSGYVQRSMDNGKTWTENIDFLSPKEYRAWPTVMHALRDGRIVLMAGCWKRGDGNDPGARMTKMMFVSKDGGKTWGEPITLMPLTPTEVGTEESDFCELPNGDLFWIHRVVQYVQSKPYGARMQSIVRREGDQWIPEPATAAPFSHTGSPAVLWTNEGLILHLATDGIYCTADTGKTWTRLPIPGTAYYPRAVQISDGRIVCIGHLGGDNPYGSDVDMAIVQQTFRLSVHPSKSGWQAHAVRQLNGRAGQIELPAQFQIVTESWNRLVSVPYIAYMPEKDRLVMLVYCDLNHRAMVLFSDDHGATWSKPRYLHTDAQGNPDVGFYTNLSLTYLGNGKLVADEDWCSDDYGNTWYALNAPGPQNVKGQTCYGWDPRLVDKDPKTGKVIRLVENSYSGADGYSQGYIRFSADEAKTWTANLEVPEWRGVNEVAFVRAGNGNIIGTCRTDNPERFKQEIDHYSGLGISISKDNGYTWSKLKMLYEWGRHHPSMVLLPNNDILMTYVVRTGYIKTADGFPQFGIEAVISHDNGETWDLDHRYLLVVWQGNRKGANSWWAGSQCTSTVLLPDGEILTAFGTGYRSQPGPSNSPTPWDVGLVKWRVNKNPVNSDRRITDAAFDSDLRNQFDPNPAERKKAEDERASEKKNIAVAKEGCQVRSSHSDKDPGFILENPYHSFSSGFLDTTPGWIEISWPKKHRISEVNIYAGEPAYAIYPSTECVPLDYLLQYQKAGAWVNLVPPVTNAMRYLEFAKTGKPAEDFKYVHKFAPTSVKKIRIYVTRSSDPGKRVSSPDKEIIPPEKRNTGLRRIEVFE